MIMPTDSFGPGHAAHHAAVPRVAVVIVNYRTPRDTVECVESLRRLEGIVPRIIVVDNDSRDGSAEQLETALGPGVVLRADANGGYTQGNNLGIERALDEGAEFVLVLNPDTVAHNPKFLAELVRHAESHPRAGAIGPRVFLRSTARVQNTVLRFPWFWQRVVGMGQRMLLGSPKRSGETAKQVEVLNGVCVLFRAEALRAVGGFDARTFAYLEDVDWAYRADRLGWQRWYVPVDSVIHRQKEAGYETGSTVDYLLKRNTLYFLLKSGHRVQAAGYTLATLGLALWRRQRGRLKSAGWLPRLGNAYLSLWRGDWDRAMGKPNFI